MTLKILSIPSLPIDNRSLRYAQEISNLDGVVDVQLFPDCFTKDKYQDLSYKITIPSSSAIITEADIMYPQFRSRGIHCGMSIVPLPFAVEEMTPSFLEDLFKNLTYDPLYQLLYRLRLPLYMQDEDLSHKSFISLLEGEDFRIKDISHLLNVDWLKKRTVRLRYSFGKYFGGNHYFEIQKADSDLPELKIAKGQAVAMFHTGCQGIQSLVRPDLAKQYFYSKQYVSTHRGEEMYEAFFVAQAIIRRYVTAYRQATCRLVGAVVRKHYNADCKIVLDKSHNGVDEEILNGKACLVYRHNAESIHEGEYAIVSGLYNHSSFVVKGGSNTKEYFNTIDHGVGMLLKRDSNAAPVLEGSTVELHRFHRGMASFRSSPTRVPLLESKVVKEYFNQIGETNLAHKTLSLQPIINLKYT